MIKKKGESLSWLEVSMYVRDDACSGDGRGFKSQGNSAEGLNVQEEIGVTYLEENMVEAGPGAEAEHCSLRIDRALNCGRDVDGDYFVAEPSQDALEVDPFSLVELGSVAKKYLH
jgi:hypothetical protein